MWSWAKIGIVKSNEIYEFGLLYYPDPIIGNIKDLKDKSFLAITGEYSEHNGKNQNYVETIMIKDALKLNKIDDEYKKEVVVISSNTSIFENKIDQLFLKIDIRKIIYYYKYKTGNTNYITRILELGSLKCYYKYYMINTLYTDMPYKLEKFSIYDKSHQDKNLYGLFLFKIKKPEKSYEKSNLLKSLTDVHNHGIVMNFGNDYEKYIEVYDKKVIFADFPNAFYIWDNENLDNLIKQNYPQLYSKYKLEIQKKISNNPTEFAKMLTITDLDILSKFDKNINKKIEQYIKKYIKFGYYQTFGNDLPVINFI